MTYLKDYFDEHRHPNAYLQWLGYGPMILNHTPAYYVCMLLYRCEQPGAVSGRATLLSVA